MLEPDVLAYIRLCEEGRFYNVLMEQGGIPPERREKFKKSFFGCVFYCENDPILPAAQTFAEQFPNVYAAIRAMKAEDYTALPKRLQRAESDLMIHGVARRCMAELPAAFILTIHDSILTTPDMADPIRRIMEEEFGKIGLSPTIRIESYAS